MIKTILNKICFYQIYHVILQNFFRMSAILEKYKYSANCSFYNMPMSNRICCFTGYTFVHPMEGKDGYLHPF